MAERRVTIGWPEGLHARPAANFVRAAKALDVPITIAKNGGTPVNAASMLGLMTLGAEGGDEVVLASDAENSDAALDRLATMVQSGLDELPEA